MVQIEHILKELNDEVQHMALLVKSQLAKCCTALVNNDRSMANEVLHVERRVNAMELQIDKLCEKIVALYGPVATDMRMVFALFKINSHLERMGDYAKNICKGLLQIDHGYDEELLRTLKITRMFEIINDMIGENLQSLITGNPEAAHKVFEMDIELNRLHDQGLLTIVAAIQSDTEQTMAMLDLSATVRRLERVGDYNTNIAEELIFCYEALVLKHKYNKEL